MDEGSFWLGLWQKSIEECTNWGCKAYGLGHKEGEKREIVEGVEIVKIVEGVEIVN